METIEKKLITWYEPDDPSKRNSIFTRHSSARQPEVTEGVCDYRLYSILEKDADLLLYNTVWDLVMHPDFYGFYEDIDVLNSSVVFEVKGGGVTWYRPYLLFPADDPSIDFHKKDMNYPYIVGAFSEFDDFYGGEAGLIEEGDGGPIFRDYYVPEWNFKNGEPEVVYREHKCGNEVSMPRIYDNEIELKKAIYELMKYIDTVNANVGVWKERLQMAHEMIKTHANELHVLHNAGLYDIETLWTLLIHSDHDNDKLRQHITAMNRELHRYAMMAVNLIDWKKGGFD